MKLLGQHIMEMILEGEDAIQDIEFFDKEEIKTVLGDLNLRERAEIVRIADKSATEYDSRPLINFFINKLTKD